MKTHNTLYYFLLFMLVMALPVSSQDCGCRVSQVESNTVNACEYSVGTVVTVATTSELRNAINQINSSGGNTTLLIADGTYPIASTDWYPYITANNVVIRSLSGNRDSVILTGTGMNSVDPNTEIVISAVGNNISIMDLTIREVGNHGIMANGDHLFVHNVRVQDTFEQMLKGNSSGDGADEARVQCSLFEYTAGVGPQWYIGGLDIHDGDNWTVNDNVFKNIASPSVTTAEHAIHFWNSSSNNTIERNIIINSDRGIGFGLGSSPSEGGIIRNNMIFNDGTGLYDDVGIGLETSPNTKVYNNSIFIAYANAIEYRFPETTNVEIFNNLTNQSITLRNSAQATVASNYTSAIENWFVNAPTGDLRLASDNPAVVNQGMYLDTVLMDIDKTPRTIDGDHDIGAFEFVVDFIFGDGFD